MHKEKEKKYIFAIFLFILLVLSSYTIVISQENSQPSGTQANTQNLPESGKVDEGKKEDLGKLVNVEPENLQVGSANYNLNDKGDVEINRLPSQSGSSTPAPKVNLNQEGDLNIKPPQQGLGDPKITVGKENKKSDDESSRVSLQEGSKFYVGEDGGKYPIGSSDVKLPENTRVEVSQDGDRKHVDMKLENGGEIITPEQKEKEEEGKETNYRWIGDNLNWLDGQGNSHTVNGELWWNSKEGFKIPFARESTIDGVNVFSGSSKGNFDTQIFSDGNAHSKSEAFGAYASFGENKLVTGSNGQTPGPLLEFQQNNKYGVNINSESDIFRIQAESNGQISLTNRNPLGNPEGKYPLVEMTGRGGTVNNGDRNYVSNGYRKDIIKNPNLVGRTQVSADIIPRNINDGRSLLAGDKSWRINGNDLNQAMDIQNNNINPQIPLLEYQGTKADPKIGQNLINSPSPLNNQNNNNPPNRNLIDQPLFGSKTYNQKVLNSNVRILVEDSSGRGYGSGTIVNIREGAGGQKEALVMTVGHLFREGKGKGNIKVDFQGDNKEEFIPGNLLYYKSDNSDMGFITIKSPQGASASEIAPRDFQYNRGMRVTVAGCDSGGPCLIKPSQVTSIDRYQGASNVEVAGASVEGRSGGGLFDENGRVIGVVYAGDNEADEALYNSIPEIYKHLDASGLSKILGKYFLILLQ